MNSINKLRIGTFANIAIVSLACSWSAFDQVKTRKVPHDKPWGIYSLDLETQDVELHYSSPNEITNFSLSPDQKRIAFSMKDAGGGDQSSEIYILDISDHTLQRLTNNDFMDTYPIWSPDGDRLAYLALPDTTLDIYTINLENKQLQKLYDSGFHDADISWQGDTIAFTRNSQIWLLNADGRNLSQLTDPPQAGQWGSANLPFGDYDPRISPDGTTVVFERLLGDRSPHGNYDLFIINIDGTNLTRLTKTGYAQGLASWSPSGEQIAYIIAAIEDEGQFDIYLMNADGSNNRNITPEFFPTECLVHAVNFENTDTKLFFLAEWYQP